MFDRRQFLKTLGLVPLSPLVPLLGKSAATPGIERTIDMFDFHVAGFQYHAGMQPRVMATLLAETELAVVREPENPHDDRAIALLSRSGARIGYVPRLMNRIPADLLDRQVPLRAVITEVNPDARTWERVRVVLRQVV